LRSLVGRTTPKRTHTEEEKAPRYEQRRLSLEKNIEKQLPKHPSVQFQSYLIQQESSR
jgi:hypothetical protein